MKHAARFVRIFLIFALLFTGLSVHPAAAQSGTEDQFGYSFSPVTEEWIDATGGTSAGLRTGANPITITGAIPLPFPFKFYENTYNNVFISAYGYVTFTGGQHNASQSDLLDPIAPNNLIAAYWTPVALGSGPTAQVYYMTGGTAPDRYFVVEWYQVDQSGSAFTFEVVLRENHNFQITHDAMGVANRCGVSGIEDLRGTDGLRTTNICAQPTSNATYQFTRPADAARLSVTRTHYGQLVASNQLSQIHIWGWNTGTLGPDVYDIDFDSTWQPATVRDYATKAVLVDTNGDGIIDTGPIAAGSRFDLLVEAQAPAFTSLGDKGEATLVLTSTLDPAQTVTINVDLAVPAPFVASFVPNSLNTPELAYFAPGSANMIALPQSVTSDLPVAETPSGNIFNVWTQSHCVTSCKRTEIYYAVYDKLGKQVKGPTRVEDLGNYLYSVEDSPVTIAAAPNGKVAITWVREVYNEANQFTDNVYTQIFDERGQSAGNIIALTNNTEYGDATIHPFKVNEVEAVATSDNNFAIGWNVSSYDNTTTPKLLTRDNYVTVIDSAGNLVKATQKVTADTNSDLDFVQSLTMLHLENGKFGVISNVYAGSNYRIHMIGLNSAGTVEKPDFILFANPNGYGFSPDAVQLSDGKILVAWGRTVIRFAILDGTTFAVLSGPTDVQPMALNQAGYVSVTADTNKHGILTWVDYLPEYQQDIYYAVVDSSGAITMNSMIMYTDENGVGSNLTGQRITSHTLFSTTQGIDLSVSGTKNYYVTPGSETTIQVQVKNEGATTANNVTVVATFPKELTIKSVHPGGSCNATSCTWVTSSLSFEGTGTITMTVATPNEQIGTRFPVTFSVDSSGTDADLTNNTLTTTVYTKLFMFLPIIKK